MKTTAERVTDEELGRVAAADVAMVAPDGRWQFHRIQHGYADGFPRAVFIAPDDEPVGIALPRSTALVMALAQKLAAEVATHRARLRTIDVELDHAGAPTGPEDGSGVYTNDGRIIALGLDVAALRAERDDLAKRMALCVADEPTGVYQEGRRAAFSEAAAWLRERAKAADAEVDDECDGVDADRFCELAETLRGEAKALEAWAKAGCPKVGA